MPAPKPVDLIVKARWIIPVVPVGKVFEHCALVVEDGRIVTITPNDHAGQTYQAKQVLELGNHAVLPGFVNAHGHAAMSLLRGFADDLPLATWLQEHIWPAESQWVSDEFVRDGSELAIAEMLASGTTCFSDMYFFPEETARAVYRAGMRAQITFPVLDFPTAWANSADDYIHKGLALHDDYRSIELINIGFGPHAPYTVSDEPFQRIAMLAAELQAPIQVHLHETAGEVSQSVKETGMRPIERLHKLNTLIPLTQCVHMTQLTEADIELLASSGASVVHCPQSNLKLASGLCPAQKLMDAGVTVALGTDGAASNNSLNMLSELNTAALIGKIAANDAAAINAHDAIRMATLMGARALGLENDIGSLEPGKAADFTAVEFAQPGSYPIYDIASHLVYNSTNSQVTHTWVNGRCLFEQGQFNTLDYDKTLNRATGWQQKIANAKPL